ERREMVLRSAEKLATPAQKERAQSLFANLAKKYADKVAAQRAWNHYQHWKRYKKAQKWVSVGHSCQKLPNVRMSGANPQMNMAAMMASQIRCRMEESNKRRLTKQRKSLVSKYFGNWI